MYKRWDQDAVLHYHGDGTDDLLPVLPRLFELNGKEFPFDRAHYAAEIRVVFGNTAKDIVERFSHTTGVMQTRESLQLAGESWVRGLRGKGMKYAEVTIAPQYHIYGDLTVEEVMASLIAGIKQGEARFPEMEVNILFAIGREVSPEEGVRLVEAAANCDRSYVVGIGLACDEAGHPPKKHIPLFRRAKDLGFKTTIHAGEWVSDEFPNKAEFEAMAPEARKEVIRTIAGRDEGKLLENVLTAIVDLGVSRIGHAIPLAYSEGMVRLVTQNNIGIEGCPGSNFTSGLIPDMQYLRIRDLLAAGVLYSLSPDDDLFLPNLQETFDLCDREYRFTEGEKIRLKRNAWLTRFGKRKYGWIRSVF